MDELTLDGAIYISARAAARAHGYTSDYVGQLLRGGKLHGRKVGRAWYVKKESLARYVAGEGSDKGSAFSSRVVTTPIILRKEAPRVLTREHELLTYISENEPLLPPLEKGEARIVVHPPLEETALKGDTEKTESVFVAPTKMKKESPHSREHKVEASMAIFASLVLSLLLTGGSIIYIHEHLSYDEVKGSRTTFVIEAPKIPVEKTAAAVMGIILSRRAE